MIVVYILLIGLACLPAWLTVKRMLNAKHTREHGVSTTALVKHIHTQRFYKGGLIDHITLEYKSLVENKSYNGRATATHKKFKVGDSLTIYYSKDNPSKMVMDGGATYWPMLIFAVLLLLLVVFAVYKIQEMVESGNFKNQRKSMEKLTIVYIILLGAGALPLLICIIKMNMLKNFKMKAEKIMTTITHVEKHIGFKGSKYYLLTLEYKMAGTTQLWNAHAKLFKKHQPGDEIPLWYLPDEPTKFSIDNGKMYPYAIAVTGLFFLLIVWFCNWLSNLEYTV